MRAIIYSEFRDLLVIYVHQVCIQNKRFVGAHHAGWRWEPNACSFEPGIQTDFARLDTADGLLEFENTQNADIERLTRRVHSRDDIRECHCKVAEGDE